MPLKKHLSSSEFTSIMQKQGSLAGPMHSPNIDRITPNELLRSMVCYPVTCNSPVRHIEASGFLRASQMAPRGRGIACIDGKLNAMSRRFALTVGAVTLIVTVMSVAFFDDSDNAVTATSTTTTVAATTTTSTSTTTTSTTSTTSTTTTTTTTTTLPTPVPPPQTTGQQSP